MSRRSVALLAIVGVLAVVAFVVLRPKGSSDRAASPVAANLFTASLCHLSELVAAGDLSGAQNVFWDDIHLQTHALVADLVPVDRAEAGRLSVAKGAVERDLGTLAPAMKTDVPVFVAATRHALEFLKVPDAQAPC